jgi:hypothetical protein
MRKPPTNCQQEQKRPKEAQLKVDADLAANGAKPHKDLQYANGRAVAQVKNMKLDQEKYEKLAEKKRLEREKNARDKPAEEIALIRLDKERVDKKRADEKAANIEKARFDQHRKAQQKITTDAVLAEKERLAYEYEQQRENTRRLAQQAEKDRRDREMKARKAKEESDRAEKRRQDQMAQELKQKEAAQRKENERLLHEKRARDELRRKEELAEQQRHKEEQRRRDDQEKQARLDKMSRLKKLERQERELLPKISPERGIYHENLEDKDPDDFYRSDQQSVLGRDDLNAAARTFIEGLHPVDRAEIKKVELHNKLVQFEREKQQKEEAVRAQREVEEHNKKWKKVFENK